VLAACAYSDRARPIRDAGERRVSPLGGSTGAIDSTIAVYLRLAEANVTDTSSKHNIVIPARATISNSSQLIGLCTEAEHLAQVVVLDATDTIMFDSFGIALIAAMVAVRRAAGRHTELVLPVARAANCFLQEVALDGFVRGEPSRPGTLEVRQVIALDAMFTDNVADLLVRGVPGINETNVYPIQLCLNELLQNVFEWSESPIGCTVLTRWYKQTRSVRLAVIDRGIGMPAALRRHQIQGLHRLSDADVIEAAVTTPQLTSRANKVGGLGLKTIREIVCDRGGRLTIVSLGAKVRWLAGKVGKSASRPLRGTAVQIDIRPSAPFDAETTNNVF
jgi:anti-sigma regulatory factor (Ser/Thr protein kinase)